MNSHQSNVFLRDLSKLFSLLIQPLYSSLFQSVSTIHGGVSRRHSQILKTEEDFYLHILSILSEVRDSNLILSSHICFQL